MKKQKVCDSPPACRGTSPTRGAVEEAIDVSKDRNKTWEEAVESLHRVSLWDSLLEEPKDEDADE